MDWEISYMLTTKIIFFKTNFIMILIDLLKNNKYFYFLKNNIYGNFVIDLLPQYLFNFYFYKNLILYNLKIN